MKTKTASAPEVPEVRYHMMRPAEVVRARKQCPVAYVPVGTIEWHGEHNPLGTDTLQAEGLAIECARTGGGLAFPPLYYGESRVEALMEANAQDRDAIAEGMGLEPANFDGDAHPYTPAEQVEHYHTLLFHILAEVESLGFEIGVLVAGHYPLIDHCRSVVLRYNQRRYGKSARMLAWACVDYLLVRDRYPRSGDHAGGWETSHVMHLHPERVDLSVLPERGAPLVGVGGSMPPQDATAEFGKETLEAARDSVLAEVRHRLEHRERYLAHGMSLAEGMWRDA